MSTHFLDCPTHCAGSELFIVEGKSALHAMAQVRSREHQAVLALQGKLPNAQRLTAVCNHKQARELFARLRCGTRENCSADNLRFDRVLIATDPDADGLHSRWLALQLFRVFLHPLLVAGRVSLVAAPQYRLQDKMGNQGYHWSQETLSQARRHTPGADNISGDSLTVFKGLASMSAQELHYWVIDPATRREQKITPGDAPAPLPG